MRPKHLLGIALALGAYVPLSPVLAQAAPPPGRVAPADTDQSRIDDLVTAYHILGARGIIDGRGHISVRSVRNPAHFYMALAVPPQEVTRADIVEFDEDSRPLRAGRAQPFSERFIHGEILRQRPDVQAVVHCHPAAVLPFTVTTAPLKALIHTAYFLGTDPAPVFDQAQAAGANNLMLVTDRQTGAALAKTLAARSVVLMRGHGIAVAAPGVRDAVYRTIYTIIDAEVEAEALRLGTPIFLNRFEATRTEWVDPLWEIWRKQAG